MRGEDPTKRHRAVATVLLISDRSEHIRACQLCADELNVRLEHRALKDAAEVAARWQPFAVVVNEAVYNSAAAQVDAMARESRATTFVLRGILIGEVLRRSLSKLLDQYFA